jgi:hypothetical protein
LLIVEAALPASIDIPLDRVANYDMETPLAFRRERNWLVSFVMGPFKDIDVRATDDGRRRARKTSP